MPEFYCLKLKKVESVISGGNKLSSLLKKIKPDIIHSLGMPPYTLSLAYPNCKHLVTLRNYCFQDYPDKYGKAMGTLLAYKDMSLIKRQYRNGKIFITCSKSLSEIYEMKTGMKFKYIRNGVDITQYYPGDSALMRDKLRLPKSKIIIAYTGQFIARKNQEFALRGIRKSKYYSNIFVVLMGDGPDLIKLKSEYTDPEHILFTGNINNVNEFLQAADIYVSSSKSEGMPNGVLEAMSSGLPVLLSDIPQHREIVDDNSTFGMTYKKDNIEDFVSKLDCLQDSNLNLMGAKAAEFVKTELSAEVMSGKYQDLYLDLINGGYQGAEH